VEKCKCWTRVTSHIPQGKQSRWINFAEEEEEEEGRKMEKALQRR
jgi:hypothetical protein